MPKLKDCADDNTTGKIKGGVANIGIYCHKVQFHKLFLEERAGGQKEIPYFNLGN